MISAIGILSIFSRRTARLNVSHCSDRILFLPITIVIDAFLSSP
jgi:hypothetical protein